MNVMILITSLIIKFDPVKWLGLSLGEDQIEHVRGDIDDSADQEDQRPVDQLVLWRRADVKCRDHCSFSEIQHG